MFLAITSWRRLIFALVFVTILFSLISCDNSQNESNKQFAEGAFGIAIDPSGKHVYVLNANSENISHYTLSANGSLQLKSIRSFTEKYASPISIATHPTKNLVYVLNSQYHSITQLTIGSDGELHPHARVKTVDAGAYPKSITIHPSGNFAYVVNGSDGDPNTVESDILLYDVENDGNLLINATVPIIDSATGAEKIRFTPNGLFAYTENTFWASISLFSVASNGELTPNSVSSLTLNTPSALVFTPNNQFAFIASNYSRGSSIVHYVVGSDGLLMPNSVSDSTPLSAPHLLTMHPSGNYLYFVAGNNQIMQYKVLNDGTLSVNENATTVFCSQAPQASLIDPSSRYLYIINYNDDARPVSQFAIAADGSLNSI